MRYQHDRVAQRNAKQRYKPHQRAQRHPAAAGEYRDHAADQCERQIDEGEQQVVQIVEGDVKQQDYAHSRQRRMHDQVGPGLRLCPGDAGVRRVIAFRQFHL